jgi:hypothetical protein
MTALSFQLFHVPGEIILEKPEAIADVATNLLWKFAELPACLLGDKEFVSHLAEVYQWDA